MQEIMGIIDAVEPENLERLQARTILVDIMTLEQMLGQGWHRPKPYIGQVYSDMSKPVLWHYVEMQKIITVR